MIFSNYLYFIFDYLLPFIDFAISFALFTLPLHVVVAVVVFWLDNSFSLQQPKMEISFAVVDIDLLLISFIGSGLACFNIFERTSIA